MQKINIILLLFIIMIYSTTASAYIGPGIGAGLIAIIIGFILTILVALFTIIYFPIKKLIKKFKKKKINDMVLLFYILCIFN